jgi:branched-chain amino acid aminotransferase
MFPSANDDRSAAPSLQRPLALAAGVAYIDGRYVPVRDASIPILDWGFLHSDATYDVASVWKGSFFRLHDHIDRFFASARSLRLDVGFDPATVASTLTECVRRSGLRDAYVEMVVTRGLPAHGSRDPRTCRNRFFAFAIPYVWILSPERWHEGLSAAVATNRRIPTASIDARIKNYHWLDFTLGLFDAYEGGAETTILLDTQSNVAEGPGFNVFAVCGGQVFTPASNILQGITRRTVLDLCSQEKISAVVDDLPVASLLGADEIFITSTAGGIVPITRIDGKLVGAGKPGRITSALNARYWSLRASGWHGDAVEYPSDQE